MSHLLLTDLNEKQCAAVSAPAGHHLILAGAGSGKTRVLVHRIAWLMQELHTSPFSILAVTFTNKAAHEMRNRIEQLNNMPLSGMWVGTFHGLAHRFLRMHWQEANLPESFQILDSDDQLRLVRRIQRSLDIDESRWPPKQAQWFISKCKEEGKRPKDITQSDYFTQAMTKIYIAYEQICQRSGLVDFSELLLRSLETLEQTPALLTHYQQRFAHILVDEFQDTNTIQYRWLKTLAGEQAHEMAVGDDDQSIYSWRGAKIENIHRFTREYPHCTTIRLEQNYRSTQKILDAANAVISHNEGRMGKNLWTDHTKGDLITLYSAFNEHDEAYYIASTIKELTTSDTPHQEIAILYRSNAQSRVLEERLLESRIPYRIYGGQKFFERAEIKDALAYLRLIANRYDDAAFERVVNLPTRGIGNTTLAKVREAARIADTSLWQTAENLINENGLSARAGHALQGFLSLIDALDEQTHKKDISDQTELMLEHSGLLAHYKKDHSEKGLSRIENLEELISATAQFHPDESAAELSPLAAFLAHVALEAGDNQADDNTQGVSLMTLHAAKGLEFPVVFLTGLEENLFPHKMSMDEAHGLEEERRLCYVGMTRAMRKLYLSYAESRRLHGMEQYHKPSRFIAEIPQELIYFVRPKTKVSRPQSYQSTSSDNLRYDSRKSSPLRLTGTSAGDSGFEVGQRVRHAKFGEGTITNYEGKGAQTRVQIHFNQHGSKWLVASFAKLEHL